MRTRRARILALWLLGLVAAVWIVVHARYITDLSAFLPAHPTPAQQLLVEQLRDGPASRLILIALEGGAPAARATLSTALAQRLRQTPGFSSIDNGATQTAERDRSFLFEHRYILSDAVTAQHFSAAGLRSAIADTVADLASSSGLLVKSLVPHDPTGELLRIADRLAHSPTPQMDDGVWVSHDRARALLVVQTAAAGSDTDAEERALDAIRQAFEAAVQRTGPAAAGVQLKMSGTPVFAVAARARIKTAATRLSIVSSMLVIGLLLAVYRSVPALLLGLLPVATGALVGIAAVALGFGAIHGVTLGFGITLIGESVDYSIYFFIQSSRRAAWWPTIRLGMLTSMCGFVSLLPSGFPGLAQLGLYSITGLLAAGLVTRFVLPELVPTHFAIRDVAPFGARLARLRQSIRCHGPAVMVAAGILAGGACWVLFGHRAVLWNRELSSLSPIPVADQRYDAQLRADLGTADVLDLIIVSGPTLDAVLLGAERVGTVLQPLIDARTIGDIDSPAIFLPSSVTQRSRRAALPDPVNLRANLHAAIQGSDLEEAQLAPFLNDVEAARHAAAITVADLQGTSLAAGFAALALDQRGHWNALLLLHAPVDLARVAAVLARAHLNDAHVLDLKAETDALYATYLHEAIVLSLAGFALIVVLLAMVLRSSLRVVRVLAPLLLAVLIVAGVLALVGERLTILHLVGMLLIVAVGSNYALFFDAEGRHERAGISALTMASLVIANASTVIAFGLLSFSQVPVLEALGSTVAPGAFLALVFAALMT